MANAVTTATIPDSPPRTTLGSFEIVSRSQHRSVYVYWQQIPTSQKNGPGFNYTVTNVLEKGQEK